MQAFDGSRTRRSLRSLAGTLAVLVALAVAAVPVSALPRGTPPSQRPHKVGQLVVLHTPWCDNWENGAALWSWAGGGDMFNYYINHWLNECTGTYAGEA